MLAVSILWNLLLTLSPGLAVVFLWAMVEVVYVKLKLKKPTALPLRAFHNNVILYTWEDWHRDNKKEFPVRYFLTETLPTVFRRLRGKCSRTYQWVRTRTWSRYHILDVRGPGY